MKAKHRLEQLKKQFDRMRKDSVAAVGTANEAVYKSLQKFADKELKALHDYYNDALASLRSAKKNHSPIKSVVQTQFDLMQDTVTRLIAHARESVETATSEIAPAPVVTPPKKTPAKKAVAKKAVAKPAAVKKPAKKAVAPVKKKAAKSVVAKVAPAPKPKAKRTAKKVPAAPSPPPV